MRRVVCALAATVAAQASMAPASTLSGANFRIDYLYDNGTTDGQEIYPNTNGPVFGKVGPGVDASIRVEDRTDIIFDFDGLSLDLLINTSLTDPVWDNITFNGIRVRFLDLPSNIDFFKLDSSSFGPITQLYSSTEILMNWPGAPYPDGSVASFSFGLSDPNPAPVPLPAGAPLLLAGLALLGGLRIRRLSQSS